MFLRSLHKISTLVFLHLMLIWAVGCHSAYIPIKMQSENIRVQIHTDTILPVTTSRFLAPYRQKLADSFSTILAVTTDDLLKERPGGSLGNLVTSAVFEYYMADNNANGRPIFVLMNYGGIRLKNIPKGEISVGKIFELLPFENTLVKIEIAGPQLANLLDTINNEGGWPCRWSENYFSSAEELKSQKNVFLLTNN